MAPQTESVTTETGEDDASRVPVITAHETTPERLVFTESGNTDGWMATDITVAIRE